MPSAESSGGAARTKFTLESDDKVSLARTGYILSLQSMVFIIGALDEGKIRFGLSSSSRVPYVNG
ncbi:MAG TPA: hypothetical protein PLZ51_07555 [Aggregatilineales bacterium]|nr:hypothetical protein [Aggregatilineales bacterium]